MSDKQKSIEDLQEIRSIMERSTQFLSLSGLSGVFAGVYALIAAVIVYFNFSEVQLRASGYEEIVTVPIDAAIMIDKIIYALIVGVVVLALSLLTGLILTKRKAQKNNLKVWTSASKSMLLSLAIPLTAGGVFCFVLIYHGAIGLVAPATLIFYGLALLNASKYTLKTIKYLGIMEIVLGLIASFFIGYGLIVWALGFGVLHIIYGLTMHFKYDK